MNQEKDGDLICALSSPLNFSLPKCRSKPGVYLPLNSGVMRYLRKAEWIPIPVSLTLNSDLCGNDGDLRYHKVQNIRNWEVLGQWAIEEKEVK